MQQPSHVVACAVSITRFFYGVTCMAPMYIWYACTYGMQHHLHDMTPAWHGIHVHWSCDIIHVSIDSDGSDRLLVLCMGSSCLDTPMSRPSHQVDGAHSITCITYTTTKLVNLLLQPTGRHFVFAKYTECTYCSASLATLTTSDATYCSASPTPRPT